jgi:phosphodiesterase/alkaline phosphatase D-like protein
VSALVALGGCHDDDSGANNCKGDCFPNGVASGDVDQSSAILWARAAFTGTVQFEYGTDPDFIQPPEGVENKKVETDTDNQGVITYIPTKVEISSLSDGTQYYYRACRNSCSSDIATEFEARGMFHTPYKDGYNGLRFGVSSCFRGDMKPFVSINNVPDRGLHFFVSLGDTVYADSKASGGLARTLPDFRKKYNLAYSQLKTPEQYQAFTGKPIDDNYFALARASTAFYYTIDDHEVVNDWAGGAPPGSQTDSKSCNGENILGIEPDRICFCNNDLNGDGVVDDPLVDPNCKKTFINDTDLYKDAMKAWYEYNPVRKEEYDQTGRFITALTANKPKLYRYRTFGKDAALFILDTRSFRSEPNILNKYDSARTMLGNPQIDDLKNDLRNAENKGIVWKFILIPEPIQQLGIAGAADRFEGYAWDRHVVLDYIETECISNVVFISGDIHANIVNNLTFKSSALDLQRWSTAWDISAGPGAYSGQSISAPGPTGTTITRGNEGENYRLLDVAFKAAMDTQLNLLNRPWTGLGFELMQVQPIPLLGGNIPVTSFEGSYVAGHSYGWSEFSINRNDQKLLVKTYGTDWYHAPSGYDVNPADGKPDNNYSNNKLKELTSRDYQDDTDPTTYILHKFEVAPRTGCPGCGDGICETPEKCGGNDTTLLQCRSDCGLCPNKSPCGDNNMCESGLCSSDTAGVCIFPQENKQPCQKDEGCKSGICNFLFCVSPQPDGNLCENDNACQSGICNITCQACKAGGETCLSGSSCCSGGCDSGFCKAESCKGNGASCGSDWECCSFDFNACSGLFNQTCK